MKRHAKGFTLIELMLVILIIGILAAIAMPQYDDYVTRTNRTAAQQYMLELASAEQQYLLDSRSYTSTIANLGVSEPSAISGVYTVTIAVSAGPPRFVITAKPVAGTTQASDGDLTINQLGVKTPAAKW
ncbi:type IV pilin protein [Umboniibacter marinipuniceus]|uniref:Type IV pilus assembly protein PilE n=1 Tax=Umboniibacter marinipuniceus TaxID=569599 RepID=A0A3M0AIF5_9GAMM|nr:type IV pilin protein [Umboniibacter marinipuniceus]RMA82385.1 type IV pilus assembly protein PilE [Umboniibacter marinipuniceus]